MTGTQKKKTNKCIPGIFKERHIKKTTFLAVHFLYSTFQVGNWCVWYIYGRMHLVPFVAFPMLLLVVLSISDVEVPAGTQQQQYVRRRGTREPTRSGRPVKGIYFIYLLAGG